MKLIIPFLFAAALVLSGCNSQTTQSNALKIETQQPNINVHDQQYNSCVDEAEASYNEGELMRSNLLNECLKSPKCLNSVTMNNLLEASDNLIKFLENEKRACTVKYKR